MVACKSETLTNISFAKSDDIAREPVAGQINGPPELRNLYVKFPSFHGKFVGRKRMNIKLGKKLEMQRMKDVQRRRGRVPARPYLACTCPIIVRLLSDYCHSIATINCSFRIYTCSCPFLLYAFLFRLFILFIDRRMASGRLWLQIGMSGWLTGDYSLRCQPVDYSDRPKVLRVGDIPH